MALPTYEDLDFAEESHKTKKVREKLKKQFALLDKQITQEAIAQTKEKIHEFISRKASDRVLLKDKNISLFDENQHAASVSKRVLKIMDDLKKQQMS